MNRSRLAIFAVIPVLVASAALANVQERKAGDTIVYDLKVGGPPGPSGPAMSGPITLALERVDGDGNAHAKTSMSVAGMAATFESTISPDGAIVPVYDPKLGYHAQMSRAELDAFVENKLALAIGTNLRPFNAFAAACAANGALRDGATWQAPLEGGTLSYTVTGHEQRSGRNVAVVTAKAARDAATTISITGDYDAVARLVVAFHAEMASGGQTETIDMDLRP